MGEQQGRLYAGLESLNWAGVAIANWPTFLDLDSNTVAPAGDNNC
jgi:hypothetical protein